MSLSPTKKKFNGRYYDLAGIEARKRDANTNADKQRAKGYKARVVQSRISSGRVKKGDWLVYID